MKWYHKYLSTFEIDPKSVDLKIIETIKKGLQEKKSDNPLVSVVLIAHNEEQHLLSCLWSLIDNKCDFPIEILAVNNNSNDGTARLLEDLGVTWFDETKKGPGFARQCGLDHAKGKYHICIDADTMYPPLFIDTHVKELQKEGVVCTYGLWSFVPTKKNKGWKLFFYERLRDLYLLIQDIKRPELNVRGMNLGFITEEGRKIKFRTDVKRGEDGKMALALKSVGRLVFLKTKKVRVVTCNSTLDQDGSLLKSLIVRIIKGIKMFNLLLKEKKVKD